MSNLGNKKVFSNNLQYYMQILNKDRSKICKDLNIKYTTLTDWVNGNVYPRIDKIELLANYFGIQKADLIETREKNIDKTKKDPIYREFVKLGLVKDGDDLTDKQTEMLIKLINATADVLSSLKDDSQK
jgi:transcriptional regulator with XRE-family HTH domain